MKRDITDEELWEIIGHLKTSPSQYRTLKTLENNFSVPSEISKKTNMNPSQVSISLQKLKKCNLVMCLNDKSKKGRIYQATDLGVEVIRIIEKQTGDLKK